METVLNRNLTAYHLTFFPNHNGFRFDLKHIATCSALTTKISLTFKQRRLGNTATAIYWRLKDRISFVDSMYDIDKYLRKDWPSIGLASLARIPGLPPKLDAGEMRIERSDSYDVTNTFVYIARDSGLHVWVIRSMRTCERYFMLAYTSRSTTWDTIAR